MEFTVGCNWDERLMDVAAAHGVEELFGKLPNDPFGGGRAAFMTSHVNEAYVRKYISRLHERGIRFNYLLNGSCFDNIEYTRKGQKRFRRFFDWLAEIETDWVTLANPFLAGMLKRHYPDIKVAVSVLARVQSVTEARYWEDLGADCVILLKGRNFPLIRAIREHCEIDLEVIANLVCLHDCPLATYHGVVSTHASQSWHPSGGFVLPWCEMVCTLKKLAEPREIIASPWIRPEDQHHYENAGVRRLKIVDRCASTEYMEEILAAYRVRKSPENLADILPGLRPAKPGQVSNTKKFAYFFRPLSYNLFMAKKLKDAPMRPAVRIDSAALEGFIDHFLDHDCTLASCERCGYCQRVAERVLHMNGQEREAMAAHYREILDDLEDGGFFSYLGPMG
ncbi:MAG: U32 family peptidase [Desulfatibacillaceae bacterium]